MPSSEARGKFRNCLQTGKFCQYYYYLAIIFCDVPDTAENSTSRMGLGIFFTVKGIVARDPQLNEMYQGFQTVGTGRKL